MKELQKTSMVVSLLLAVGCLLFVSHRADAAIGDPTTILPSSGNRMVVSDATGAGAYNNPTSTSYLYVPASASSASVRLTYENPASGLATMSVTYAPGCLATSSSPNDYIGNPNVDSTITITNDSPYTLPNTSYRVYCVQVSTTSTANVFFTLTTDTPGALLGNYPGASDFRGTGYGVQDTYTAGAEFNQLVSFSPPCGTTAGSATIQLYDLDIYENRTNGVELNPYLRVRLRREHKITGDSLYLPLTGQIASDAGGRNYIPVTNDDLGDRNPAVARDNIIDSTLYTTQDPPLWEFNLSGHTYSSDYKYILEVNGVRNSNKIRIKIPYDQIYSAINCRLPNDATCTITAAPAGSAVYINEPFSVTVRFTNTGSNTWTNAYNYGPTSGTTYTAITPNVAPGGTLTRTINWTPTAVDANHVFTWRIRRGTTAFGESCSLTRHVIYRRPVVECRVTPPGTLETGTQATASLVVTYNNPPGGTANPNGNVSARSLSNGTADTPPPVTYAPAALPISIARGAAGRNFTVNNIDIGNPGQLTWSGSATVQTDNGIGGIYSDSDTCGSTSLASNLPYLKEFGGEVWSGGAFGGTCQPPGGSPGAIYAFDRDTGAARYAGASAQYTVTALLRINNFHSVSNHDPATAGLNSYAPKGLSFGNYATTASNVTDRGNANSTFGGGYGNDNGKCITDFYTATQDASIRHTGTFPPSSGGTTLVATTNVPSTSATGQSVAIPAGTYQLEVSGTYLFRGAAVPGSVADAYCANDNTGTWNNTIAANTTANILELLVNGSAVGWQAVGPTIAGTSGCAVNHTYRATISTPSPINFRLFDGNTLDNVGSLTVRISSLSAGTWPAPGRHQYVVNNDLNLNGMTVPVGQQIAVYVNGDVYISNNIVLTEGAYSNVEDIPFFAIIARGNIYIDQAVGRIDGMFVAQPNGSTGGNIYTCTRGGSAAAAVPFGPSATPANDIYARCGTQLSVNGSLIAKRIKFLRTYQSLRSAAFGENPDFANGQGTNGAEVVNYLPRMWLAPSPLRDPNSPEDGSGSVAEPYDAIRALPPVY